MQPNSPVPSDRLVTRENTVQFPLALDSGTAPLDGETVQSRDNDAPGADPSSLTRSQIGGETPHPSLDGDFSTADIADYFSGGNGAAAVGEQIIQRGLNKDGIVHEVDYSTLVTTIMAAGYLVRPDGFVTSGDADKRLTHWRIHIDDLIGQPGYDFFKATAIPLINQTVELSDLNKAILDFTPEQMAFYLSQLWLTVKTTPRGFLAAVTQPVLEAPRRQVLGVLRDQIIGIMSDELDRKEKVGGNSLKVGGGVLLLEPRDLGEKIVPPESREVRLIRGHTNAQHGTIIPETVSLGTLLDNEDDFLFGPRAHLRDFERSLDKLLGDKWRSTDIAPEIVDHCRSFCRWLSGDYFDMYDGSRSPEKIAYWLVAASVESRFPERVSIIMRRLAELYPEDWEGSREARRFWKLHELDAGEHGHGEALINTLGVVFPPIGVGDTPDTQAQIALERLHAVEATARYFDQILEFDKFMLKHVNANYHQFGQKAA